MNIMHCSLLVPNEVSYSLWFIYSPPIATFAYHGVWSRPSTGVGRI